MAKKKIKATLKDFWNDHRGHLRIAVPQNKQQAVATMNNSRYIIISWLRKEYPNSLNIAQLSQKTSYSRTNIVHHLKILHKEKIITLNHPPIKNNPLEIRLSDEYYKSLK